MEKYIKTIGNLLPIQYVAKFLFDRFVGKYVDEQRTDLSHITFEGDKVIVNDLNLNTQVSATSAN
jgi:hypothetical protein